MGLSPGQRVGPYDVIDRLGAGGMGEVYRARDLRLQRNVALKILPEAVAVERRQRPEAEYREKRYGVTSDSPPIPNPMHMPASAPMANDSAPDSRNVPSAAMPSTPAECDARVSPMIQGNPLLQPTGDLIKDCAYHNPLMTPQLASTIAWRRGDFRGQQRSWQRAIGCTRANGARRHRSPRDRDGTWFAGGETRVNGVPNPDLQRNTRVGVTLSVPSVGQQSVKFVYSTGTTTRRGSDFDTFNAMWQLVMV